MKFGKRCGGTKDSPKKCCQALTQKGKQCVREATIQVDMTKNKIKPMKCCFVCTQHAALVLGVAIQYITSALAFANLDWNEYLVVQPEYLNEKLKEVY